MPRKAFVADLREATEACASGDIDVHNLRQGDDDGDFIFKYGLPSSESLQVEAHVSVDDYPTSHTYFVYTNSENVDRKITKALEDFSLPEGVKLAPMLTKVAKILGKATAKTHVAIGSQFRPINLDSDAMDIDVPDQSDSEEELNSEFGDVSEADDEDEEDGGFSPSPSRRLASLNNQSSKTKSQMSSREQEKSRELREKLRQDILVTKKAGFRVGLLGDLLNPNVKSFLTLSCRVFRLGISQEAMRAWHLDSSRYLTLIIQFSSGYKTLQEISDESPTHKNPNVQMRVGSTKNYKVTFEEACDAFRDLKRYTKEHDGLHVTSQDTSKSATGDQASSASQGTMDTSTEVKGLNPIFVSRPLNELLNQRLLHLLKYRVNLGMPWGGAELYYNLCQGRQVHDVEPTENRFLVTEDAESYSHLPKLVTSDHLNDSSLFGYTAKASLPLLAMQFTLRHVVRCTEFCLVCHVKIDANFEALKPYVCSNPLCLYQYLNLGMGQAIEHEVLTQPDVVDLLVSFCYASSQANRLKSLPMGMTLMVPSIAHVVHYIPPPEYAYLSARHQPHPTTATDKVNQGNDAVKFHPAKLNQVTHELIFNNTIDSFRPGDWICIIERSDKENQDKVHCKILSTQYRCLSLGPAISTCSKFNSCVAGSTISTPASLSSCVEVDVYRYDRLFDDLPREEQMAIIGPILNTLPSTQEMGDYLRSGKGRSLEQWSDRVSPTALGLLRWIIASNRSCIIQVDNTSSKESTEERVGGMPSYLQFRFAQGAPDKEQRFVNAVHENSRKTKPKHSTIFAWHGSGLCNWHGIVREGLNFEETVNGRAFGHGVYHSLDAAVSLGYSGFYPGYHSRAITTRSAPTAWRQSRLQVEHALSLNEIVNSPLEFVSKSPHLVIDKLDWIQTRYLFVKCQAVEVELKEEKARGQLIEQDPTYFPKGPKSEALTIPITAVSKSRRPEPPSPKVGDKRSGFEAFQVDGHIVLSDDTDAEDLDILLSDVDVDDEVDFQTRDTINAPTSLIAEEAPKVIIDSKMTDFMPGTIDHSTLPLFDPPAYATIQGTRTLQRQLQETLKTQATTPIHELGWYIDPELITNMYQWIIELHTFDSALPISKDLKSRKLKSIVVEFRFGSNFPFSPPFVRIIRPRFLPLMQGGGGHVTAGGAMCMQLLTNDGWSSVNNMESVLLQIKLAIESTEPKPARLEAGPVRDYGIGEAAEAFMRACRTHGWKIPEDFASLSTVVGSQK